MIRAGFASQLPEINQLWAGNFSEKTLPAESPTVVFWVHIYGVLKGDQEWLLLRDPTGKLVANVSRPVTASQKIWTASIGKKGTQEPLLQGNWSGQYQLLRGQELLIDHQESVNYE